MKLFDHKGKPIRIESKLKRMNREVEAIMVREVLKLEQRKCNELFSELPEESSGRIAKFRRYGELP